MSIYKYSGEYTRDLTAVTNWLNDKKVDTIFSDVSFIINKVSDTNTTLTISKGSVTISINTQTFSYVPYDILKFTGVNTFVYTPESSGFGNGAVYFKNAMICNNGIIFELGIDKNSGTRITKFVAITMDSNNNLAMVYPIGSANDSNYATGFNTVVYDSTDSNAVTLIPKINGSISSLGSVSANSTNNVLILNAYVAITTQLSAYGLNAVTFGDEPFITDGYFYIKD